MRKQTMGGTQQYIPVVNAGELGFGISNISQYHMAQQGIQLSKGRKYSNLRLDFLSHGERLKPPCRQVRLTPPLGN